MLFDILDKFTDKKICLASGSPRRVEYLKLSGLNFEVLPSTFPEDQPPFAFKDVEEYVLFNSANKAMEVSQRFDEKPYLVIGCDTVIELNGKVLEKPKSRDEAIKTLLSLSGKTHHVFSGVTLIFGEDEQVIHFTEKTDVTFSLLPLNLIQHYCDTDEPYDKAGAYGIQSAAGCFVKKINGDFYNVTGLPLNRLCQEIRNYCLTEEGMNDSD